MRTTGNHTSWRNFLGMLAGAAAALALPLLARGAEAKRPNVLILQPDQHRGTIMGCAGDPQAITPNLDRYAAEGIRFSRNVSASPVCSPCRGSIQTGLYPHKHGVTGNGIQLDTKFKCLAEVFGEAGYATRYIGKWHLDGNQNQPQKGTSERLVPAERRHGWQEWDGYERSHAYLDFWKFDANGKGVPVKGYDWEPSWQTEIALDFAKRNSAEHKPWLCYISYGPPHKPEECPEKWLKMYDPDKFVLPPDIAGRLSPKDEKSLRKEWQVYYAQVTGIDHEIGRLFDGLKQLGIDRNTIILYTSDHGDLLGSHWSGGEIKEAKKVLKGAGAAKAAKGAGKGKGKKGKGKKGKGKKAKAGGDNGSQDEDYGKARGKAAAYSTAFRTPFLVRWPDRIKGGQVCDVPASSVDFAPTVLDLAGLPPIPGAQGDSLAGWCLKGQGPAHEGVWIGLSKWRAAWDGRYVYSPLGFNHLYDLETDPYEMKNLMNSPEHKEVRQRMQALLIKLAERAEDPLLDSLRAIRVP